MPGSLNIIQLCLSGNSSASVDIIGYLLNTRHLGISLVFGLIAGASILERIAKPEFGDVPLNSKCL